MSRTLRGWLRSLNADWPPYDVVALDVAAGVVHLTFDDVLIPDEHLPLRRWREARWVASLTGGHRWDVRRLWRLEDKKP